MEPFSEYDESSIEPVKNSKLKGDPFCQSSCSFVKYWVKESRLDAFFESENMLGGRFLLAAKKYKEGSKEYSKNIVTYFYRERLENSIRVLLESEISRGSQFRELRGNFLHLLRKDGEERPERLERALPGTLRLLNPFFRGLKKRISVKKKIDRTRYASCSDVFFPLLRSLHATQGAPKCPGSLGLVESVVRKGNPAWKFSLSTRTIDQPYTG